MRLIWLLVAVLVLIPAVPSEAQSPPLTYSAISNRTVYPYPPLPSVVAGAGYQFTDPVFGSKILRVTDANTRPDSVGRFWASPSSAESTAWNTDSTKFYVMGGGGEQIPYTFDPTTMTASRIGDVNNGSGGLFLLFNGEPTFSLVDPDILYGDNGSQIVAYRFSTATQTVLHDVRSCLPGIALHALNLSVSKDDQQLLTYIGGANQDADTTVYVYDRTKGCRWLNTQTGQVGGQWGPTGRYTGDTALLLHNARLSKGGQFARLVTSNGGAGTYYWDIGTLNLLPCDNVWPNFCEGHAVMGFTEAINQRQLGDAMDFAIRPMASPNSGTAFPGLINPLLTTPTRSGTDTHPSWNNVEADERQPVCMEVYHPDNLVQRAWDGEIICAAMDGSFNVWRFAHHRSNAATFWDQPRANVSQDGRFVLFTSNWDQTLGTGRRDAFIVQLAGATTTTTITDDTDNFTGTAGTVLSSYRPGIWHHSDGSAFEIEVSTPTSGAAGAGQSLTAQLDTNLRINPWANDQWAQITLNRLDTKSGGVVLRWNGTNGYAFGRDSNNHPDGYLIEKTDANLGTTTVLAGPTGTPAVGDVIQARIQGSSLTLLVNGNTLLTATDATITSGQPGLFLIDLTAAGQQNLTAWSAGHFQ